MRKRELSDEYILKRLRGGWHFHIKKVGKYRYLISRKKQETKSHGPFNDSGWKRIQELRRQWLEGEIMPAKICKEDDEGSQANIEDVRITRANRYFKTVKAMQDKIRDYRALYMHLLCMHEKEGYCTFWKYSELKLQSIFDDFFKFFGDSRDEDAKKIIAKNGDVYWLTRAIASICTGCPVYLYKSPL